MMVMMNSKIVAETSDFSDVDLFSDGFMFMWTTFMYLFETTGGYFFPLCWMELIILWRKIRGSLGATSSLAKSGHNCASVFIHVGVQVIEYYDPASFDYIKIKSNKTLKFGKSTDLYHNMFSTMKKRTMNTIKGFLRHIDMPYKQAKLKNIFRPIEIEDVEEVKKVLDLTDVLYTFRLKSDAFKKAWKKATELLSTILQEVLAYAHSKFRQKTESSSMEEGSGNTTSSEESIEQSYKDVEKIDSNNENGEYDAETDASTSDLNSKSKATKEREESVDSDQLSVMTYKTDSDMDDTDSEFEQFARRVLSKRKSDLPPPWREELYVSYFWEYSDIESLDASVGSDHEEYQPRSHISRRSIPTSSGQDASVNRRNAQTDTSGEESHFSFIHDSETDAD